MWYLYLGEFIFYAIAIGIIFAIFKIKKVEKLKIVLIILPVCLLVTLGLTFILEKPLVTINENINYEVGEKEELDKIVAKYHFMDVSNNVKIEGNVDFNEVGKYEVKYIVPTLLGGYTKTQHIEIVDTKAPTITLEGQETEEISYKDEYKEAGFTVSDNSNEDLKDKVELRFKKFKDA